MLRLAMLAALAAAFAGCGSTRSSQGPTRMDTSERTLQVGQKWRYHARPGEEQSTLTILKIEAAPHFGVIVHVRLDGLRIHRPSPPGGFTDTIGHLPFAESAIEKSVIALVAPTVPLPDFDSGYQQWRRAFDVGKAGVFTAPVADVVAAIDSGMNR